MVPERCKWVAAPVVGRPIRLSWCRTAALYGECGCDQLCRIRGRRARWRMSPGGADIVRLASWGA